MKKVVILLGVVCLVLIYECKNKQKDLEYLIRENKYGNYVGYSKLEQIASRNRIKINKEFEK